MTVELVVGVDGGNTKTVAAVATAEGEVLGTALGKCSDIYGAASAADALGELVGVVSRALAAAGVRPSDVAGTVGSLAGADWPEDHELYRCELSGRAGLSGVVKVVNDGLGPVRLAHRSGTGVALVLGTGSALGARGPSGAIWHGSFWLPVGASAWLGREALSAVNRAALGIGPPTSLTPALLALVGTESEEALLHALTRRDLSSEHEGWERAAGTCLLDADAGGDPVARDVIATYAARLAPYVSIAARKVGLGPEAHVVLTGGLLRHRASSLQTSLVEHVTALLPGAQVARSDAAPVAGALLEAMALVGTEVTDDLMGAVVGASHLLALGNSYEGASRVAPCTTAGPSPSQSPVLN